MQFDFENQKICTKQLIATSAFSYIGECKIILLVKNLSIINNTDNGSKTFPCVHFHATKVETQMQHK